MASLFYEFEFDGFICLEDVALHYVGFCMFKAVYLSVYSRNPLITSILILIV